MGDLISLLTSDSVSAAIGNHWGFVCVAAILALAGQTAKAFARGRHPSNVAARFWLATLPFHPAIAGAALGAVKGMPLPIGLSYGTESILYYAASGVASVYGYDALRTWLKYKGGRDVPDVAGSEADAGEGVAQ